MPKETRVNGRTKAVPSGDPQPMRSKPAGSGKPKLGQHFLADRNAALTIVEALGNISDQIVIEIGPAVPPHPSYLFPPEAWVAA